MVTELIEHTRHGHQGGQSHAPEDPGQSPPQRQQTTAAKPPAGNAPPRLDPALAQKVCQSVLPVFEDLSRSMIQATVPVLREYQQQMARAIAQQVEQTAPLNRGQLQHKGPEEEGQAPQAVLGQQQQQPSGQPTQESDDAASRSSPDEQPRRSDKSETNEREAGLEGSQDEQSTRGAIDMATPTEQTNQAGNQETNPPATGDAGQRRANGRQAGSEGQQVQHRAKEESMAPARGAEMPTYFYDPQAAARAGLLHLAAAQKDAGRVYSAIGAYERILQRYPDTGAAAAAAEGLLKLAAKLEKEGRYYSSLNIYDKLEQLL
jgi:hypothetical protein